MRFDCFNCQSSGVIELNAPPGAIVRCPRCGFEHPGHQYAQLYAGASSFDGQAQAQKKRLGRQQVACPSCGSPLVLPEEESAAVSCPHCRAVHDPRTLAHGLIYEEEHRATTGTSSHALQCKRCGQPGVTWEPGSTTVHCSHCGQSQPTAEYHNELAGAYAAFGDQLQADQQTMARILAEGAPCKNCGATNPVAYKDISRGFTCSYCGAVTPLTHFVSPRTVAHYSHGMKQGFLPILYVGCALVLVLLVVGGLAIVGWIVFS